MAATWSRSGSAGTISRVFIQAIQSCSATHAPVMAAVRVPPSAWITSQSIVICRSPSAERSSTARRLRPISRWISIVRPLCLPAEASRRVRSEVARGSMPYSAVTQPRACPLSQGGRRSSSVAVTSTWVSPNFTKQEPSAYFTTPRSSEIARSSSGCRRLGRILISCVRGKLLRASAATDKRAKGAARSSKADEVELGQRHLRADARRGGEVPRGIELGEHIIGGHAVDRNDYLESAQRRSAGRVQHRGLRLRAHGYHRLDALVLEGLLQIAGNELVRPQGGQHRLSRRRGKLRENVGGDRTGYRDAVDDESALAARLRHQVENFCDRARATRTALVGAGLLGEIHHQQRRLVWDDRCRLERRGCRKRGRCPFVDDGLPVGAGTYS